MKEIKLNEKDAELIQSLLLFLKDNSQASPAQNKLYYKINKQLIKKPIKVSSRKAKGRNLQKWAVEQIAVLLNEPLSENKDVNNIRSREMGQAGTDIWIHKSLLNKFPIAVECKAQENISLNQFIKQAKSNVTSEMKYWMLLIKNKVIQNPVVVMEWDLFAYLFSR